MASHQEMRMRAEIMTDLGKNRMTNGKVLLDWKHDGVRCQLLPDDRNGVLRISIGGGDGLPVHGDYCNIRGDVGRCIRLVEKALAALRKCPE